MTTNVKGEHTTADREIPRDLLNPLPPPGRRLEVKRILGNRDLWIIEYTITYQGRLAYTVSIMEFRNGKVVHETQLSAFRYRMIQMGLNVQSPEDARA